MLRQWEEFQLGPNTRTGDNPRISLNVRGIFTLNTLAFNALNEPEAVVLLFDKINGLIGLKKVDPEAKKKNAYPVQKQGLNNNWLIRAKTFCQFHQMKINNTVVFNNIQVEKDTDGNSVLVLNLRDISELAPREMKPKEPKEQKEAKDDNRGLFVLGSNG